VFFEDGATLENETITSPAYSTQKAPFGFPMGADTWTLIHEDTTARTQSSPTSSVWYNLGSNSLVIPIGEWVVDYQVSIYLEKTTSATILGFLQTTLSTANNSESDKDLTNIFFLRLKKSRATLGKMM